MVVLRAKNKYLPHFSVLGVLCIWKLSPNRLGKKDKKTQKLFLKMCEKKAECEEKCLFSGTRNWLTFKRKVSYHL